MLPRANTGYVAEAVGYLASDYARKTVVAALCSAFVESAQEIESALWQVYNLRQLSNATGVQVAKNGALVGQDRNGMSDADYIAAIVLRAAVNRATGRDSDWSTFAAILLRTASGPVEYYEGTAAFFFGVYTMELNSIVVAAMLGLAVPPGVRAVFGYSTWPGGNDFVWSSVYDGTIGQGGWGSVYDPTVGGLMVAAQDMKNP